MPKSCTKAVHDKADFHVLLLFKSKFTLNKKIYFASMILNILLYLFTLCKLFRGKWNYTEKTFSVLSISPFSLFIFESP
jgi:hypothetical protein